MDALALLCNLLAEGPATLKVLRREGVRTVYDIETLSHERLASMLGVSTSGARRFAGEARMLAARMGTAPLEREEDLPVGAAVPAADSFVRESRRPADSRHAVQAPRTPPVSGTLLRPGLIEGLDAELCGRLSRQEILTVEALANACDRNLAKQLGLGLPRLLDLAYLARGLMAEAGTVSSPADLRAERQDPAPGFASRSRRAALSTTPSPVNLITVPRGRDEDVAGPFV